MKFSTGFFDGLFGKKTTLQVTQDDGTTRDVPVTEAWLEKMQAEGKIDMTEAPSDTVPFYITGTDGSETRQLRVGTDIPEEQYKKLADPKTGALYGLTVYENGVPRTNVVPKHIWEQGEAAFGEIDRAGSEAKKRTMDRFKNL